MVIDIQTASLADNQKKVRQKLIFEKRKNKKIYLIEIKKQRNLVFKEKIKMKTKL